jgi:hypothetical protein
LPTLSSQASYYGPIGATWPPTTKGFLQVFVRDDALVQRAGIVVTMSPASGIGPIYDDPLGVGDTSLHATSTGGTGHFADLEPHEVELTFGPADLICSLSFGGWPSNRTNVIRLPIVAGFETRVGERCF